MAEIQHDSSCDVESSDVLEGTPEKEDYNRTLIFRTFTSKKNQPHDAELSDPEESLLRKKDEEGSLYHSTPMFRENESKAHVTEREYHSQEKGKKLGMLRSSRSLQAHMSSDEESDGLTPYGNRHRRNTVESAKSETSQGRGVTQMDTPEEPSYSLKLTSEMRKHRQRRKVILSDSEGSVTGETEGLVVSSSPELLKSVSTEGISKKNKCTIDSSDSDASDILEKSVTAGKYRHSKLIESSDSETGSVIEETPPVSDSSSLATTPDKNAAVDPVLREAELNNGNERPVLETRISRNVPVQGKGFKSPIPNVVAVSDALVKPVKNCDNYSTVQPKKVSSSSLPMSSLTCLYFIQI